MRRFTVLALVVVALVAGCWIASDRAGDDDSTSVEETAPESDGVATPPETDDEPKREPPLPTAEGDHYEAYDLLTNRPLAHRVTFGPEGRSSWLDGGSFDFVRYIVGNHRQDWIVDAEVTGDDETSRAVAAVRGRRGRLTMPAYVDDAGVIEARVYNPAAGSDSLDLRVDGHQLESASLEPGWQRIAFERGDAPISADAELRFEFSNLGRIEGILSGGAFDWIRIGPEDDEDAEAADVEDEETGDGDETGPHQLVAEQEEALVLKRGQGLSWVAWLANDGLVELEIGADSGCGPTVELGAEDDDGGVEVVDSTTIELVEGRGDVQTTVVEPTVDASGLVRLDIGLDADAECDVVEIETARLIRPGAIDGVPEEFEPPKYVVVWLIDTLRADYLPIHFDTDVQAPNLERLADGGVSFETAYVQGTESRASHATLFTGKYPERHGVMQGGTINPYLTILPHFFRDLDYATANLVANGYVSHLLNLDRGWDHYRNYVHEERAVDAETLLADGLTWIDERDGESFFLYLGTVDPHATYRRHDDFIGLYDDEDYQGRFRRHLSGEALGEIKAGKMELTEREKEWIVSLYKNEITYNDHVFGQLREALEEEGIWEDTLVVVTSDHGEEFWEHGSVGHGHNVHQEMVHVPLMFHYPRELPGGQTVRSGGEVVDVVPTIRDMLGQERLDDRQGRSLLPTMYGEHGGYPAPAIATQYGLEYAIEIRDWKLLLDSSGFELFDRREDPLELEDVADDHPLASRWLQDGIGWFRTHRRDWDKSTWGVVNEVNSDFLRFVDGADDSAHGEDDEQ